MPRVHAAALWIKIRNKNFGPPKIAFKVIVIVKLYRGVRVLSGAFGPPYLASAGVPRAGLLRVGVGRDAYYKNETMPMDAP